MDIFLGTIVNGILIVAGSAIGLLFKGEKLKSVGERIFQVFAFFVITMGVSGASGNSQTVIILVSIIIGVAIGEIIDIDKHFTNLGNWAEKKFMKNGGTGTFAQGFIQATLLFCIGSMAFMGAMEAALQHQHTIYYTKAVLDGISAITIAMGMGIGTMFSAIPVIVYQSVLVCLSYLMSSALSTEVVNLCSTIGSLFLIAIGTNMLGLTKLKVANFLPAMFIPIFLQLLPFVNI